MSMPMMLSTPSDALRPASVRRLSSHIVVLYGCVVVTVDGLPDAAHE
jgi:hypothetical protein